MTRVLVLGGGVGGLGAAHELAERGFSVAVVEANERFGGKSRSFPGPTAGDGTLPAEHGFRFFPGFYQHVTDTIERIPRGDGSVGDDLVETTQFLHATADREWIVPTDPRTLGEHRHTLWSVLGGPVVPTDEEAFFLNRLLHLRSSCDRLWREEFERVGWWGFIEADRMSPEYRTVLGRGISQSLVATRPREASTRTIGRIYLQLLQGIFDESMAADYVLNGPTSDVWIDPRVSSLRDLGVELRSGATVRAIESDGERVTGVRIEETGTEATERADYYVAALPVEAMVDLVTPAAVRAAPALDDLDNLETAWMNGVMFYLDRDLRLAGGHGIYYDAPWALTSISQRQFWAAPGEDPLDADGIEGVLSVVISDWESPGILYGKPARECSPEETREEVWAQLEVHLNAGDETMLPRTRSRTGSSTRPFGTTRRAGRPGAANPSSSTPWDRSSTGRRPPRPPRTRSSPRTTSARTPTSRR